MEGSAAIISVEKCTGRAFPVITVCVNCAGQSYQGDIFSKVTSLIISSHEHFFDMSNGDTCLYGGGVSDEEHSMPRLRVHLSGSSDIFSDAVLEGLIKDAFVVVTVFNNIKGDARDGEILLIDSIPDALVWNKNKGGANQTKWYYICAPFKQRAKVILFATKNVSRGQMVLMLIPRVLISFTRVLIRNPWVLQNFLQVKRFPMPISN